LCASIWRVIRLLLRPAQLLDPNAAKLHAVAVSQKTDVAAATCQSRMLLQHARVLDVVQVRVHDDSSVYFHRDLPPFADDFLLVPLADRL